MSTASARSQEREHRWAAWLAVLPPWDLHTVLRYELEWHDEFVAGDASLNDLAVRIRAAQGVRELQVAA
jgi:hypothetical protein